jgi:glyoxylase-like metal-dependent hydrolase (beta-lactamase superfamily II)
MAEEVAPGIFRIGLRRRNRIAPFSVSVYVIAGEDGLVFDGGLGGRKAGRFLHREIRSIEATMAARGIPCSITRVLPSHGHWDHFSGVAYMKKHLGLTVLSTPKMFESMGSRSNYRESFWKEREIDRKSVV